MNSDILLQVDLVYTAESSAILFASKGLTALLTDNAQDGWTVIFPRAVAPDFISRISIKGESKKDKKTLLNPATKEIVKLRCSWNKMGGQIHKDTQCPLLHVV